MSEPISIDRLVCPAPVDRQDRILLGHGSGGRLSAQLIQNVFLPALGNPVLLAMEDQAVIAPPEVLARGGRLAVTTDSFVVRPIFFPGGDIGSLAVHGTINDLAVGGAKPLWLAAAFILEEGLETEALRRIVAGMKKACDAAGVAIICGDTKVVDRGACDKIFITTTGVGVVPAGVSLSVRNAKPGDRVLLSGTIGDHGMAIMSVREGLTFETELQSDSAPLAGLVDAMLAACPAIRCMRDPTRGGLSSTANEIAAASRVGIRLDEAAIPIRPPVKAACEMLGLDPLYVANEGKLVAIVPDADAARLLTVMRSHPLGRDAALIGQVVGDLAPGRVTMRSLIGTERIVSMLAGEQLPRIC